MSPTYRVRIEMQSAGSWVPHSYILDGDSTYPTEWTSYDAAEAFATRLNEAVSRFPESRRRRYVVEAPGCEW